jgi:hypothetical protein
VIASARRERERRPRLPREGAADPLARRRSRRRFGASHDRKVRFAKARFAGPPPDLTAWRRVSSRACARSPRLALAGRAAVGGVIANEGVSRPDERFTRPDDRFSRADERFSRLETSSGGPEDRFSRAEDRFGPTTVTAGAPATIFNACAIRGANVAAMRRVLVCGSLALVACVRQSTYDKALAENKRLRTALDAALQERRSAEAHLDDHLSPRERWAHGTRTPEKEVRVRAFLDKIFEVKERAQSRPYEIECRGMVCRLSVLDSNTIDRDTWMRRAQSPDGAAFWRGWQFYGGETYMVLDDPKAGPWKQLMVSIALAIEQSPAIAACKKDNPATGAMTLTISLSPDRKLTATVTGPLATQAVGVCIRRAAENAVATIPVPAEVTHVPDIPIPFEAL